MATQATTANDDTRLHLTLDDLFLYLTRATMCLSHKDAEIVYNGMADVLMEWNDTPRSELRKTFRRYGLDFKEDQCARCNEDVPEDWMPENDDDEPLCEECAAEAAAEAAAAKAADAK